MRTPSYASLSTTELRAVRTPAPATAETAWPAQHRITTDPLADVHAVERAVAHYGERYGWSLPGRRVCVVGAGFGSALLAHRLAEADYDVAMLDITMPDVITADRPDWLSPKVEHSQDAESALQWRDLVVLMSLNDGVLEVLRRELPHHAVVISDLSASAWADALVDRAGAVVPLPRSSARPV